MTQVLIDRIVSNIRALDGVAPETVRAITAAVIPAIREMLDHERRVAGEKSTSNGYVDRIEQGQP